MFAERGASMDLRSAAAATHKNRGMSRDKMLEGDGKPLLRGVTF